MKKFIGIIIYTILVLTTVACNSNNTNKLVYAGKGNEWEASVEYNTGGTCKTLIKYLGNDKKPMEIKFVTEWISGNTSNGIGEYTESHDKVGGLIIQTDNDDKINGNIKKYKNKDSLKVEIEWNNKKEQIVLIKQTTS
ncbi:hypothetical protein G9F71_012910 [Clostridium sp. FP2]|uniref:hypothetical protein n=1 Tax=Clostridium sp. FP2 TaxID=2724481 RepID=UPI0013E945C0|nr:hypothetical protein [Clostridium sp. FP2]MBZ9623748.1 hypothetical protein [Clostridium sp. FP2]